MNLYEEFLELEKKIRKIEEELKTIVARLVKLEEKK